MDKLPAGKELETVCRMVDIREFLPMIEGSKDPKLALKFVQEVMLDNPYYFKQIYLKCVRGVDDYKVREFINRNEMISAVKYIREATGWGLKESKGYYDNIKNNM